MADTPTPGDRLATVHLMATLSDDERTAIARECIWRMVGRGQVIFDKDDPNRDVMFVVHGSVEVTSYSITGKEISFDHIPEGDFFGELAAIDTEPRSATVVASTRCELASLSPERFRRLLDEHREVAWKVLNRMATVIRTSNERLMDFATLSAHQRVCVEILKMARPDAATPGAWAVYPMPTQSAISSRIGTSRETVARVIGELIKGGVMSKKGRSIFIPDRERLETLTRRLGKDF